MCDEVVHQLTDGKRRMTTASLCNRHWKSPTVRLRPVPWLFVTYSTFHVESPFSAYSWQLVFPRIVLVSLQTSVCCVRLWWASRRFHIVRHPFRWRGDVEQHAESVVAYIQMDKSQCDCEVGKRTGCGNFLWQDSRESTVERQLTAQSSWSTHIWLSPRCVRWMFYLPPYSNVKSRQVPWTREPSARLSTDLWPVQRQCDFLLHMNAANKLALAEFSSGTEVKWS